MIIKDLGSGVANIWDGLRPVTKQMLVGVLQSGASISANPSPHKYAYDAHADWELSRLLSALDAQSKTAKLPRDQKALGELNKLAETCVLVLESQSGSAEVFIQLAERAIAKNDYDKLDKLADSLAERFSTGEVAEIVRQTELPQIRAIAYETLALMPVTALAPLLEDSLYTDIVANALEQKAFEYESEDARVALDIYDSGVDFQ